MNLSEKILACYYTGIPLLIWGDPGLGKTATIKYIADKLNVPIETIISSTREPSDFLGLPKLTKDGVEYVPPKWVRSFSEGSKGILFFDELGTCPPMIHSALLRIINEGWVGEYKLPEDTYRIAASNFTNVSGNNELSLAMANRFIHIKHSFNKYEFSKLLKDRFEYELPRIINNKNNPELYSELKNKYMKLLSEFIEKFGDRFGYVDELPDSVESIKDYAYPTPRSWTNVVEILSTLEGNEVQLIKELVLGTVGELSGEEFIKFLNSKGCLREFTLNDILCRDDLPTYIKTKIVNLSYDELEYLVFELSEYLENNDIDKCGKKNICKLLAEFLYDSGYKGLIFSYDYIKNLIIDKHNEMIKDQLSEADKESINEYKLPLYSIGIQTDINNTSGLMINKHSDDYFIKWDSTSTNNSTINKKTF